MIRITLVLIASVAAAQPIGSLKGVAVPRPSELGTYVRDEAMLVALGKAFFWDMQVGSDERQACASCHFHAGADHRAQNQLAGESFRPNHRLTVDDFPFGRDNTSVAGSAGVFRRLFRGLDAATGQEMGLDQSDAPSFAVGGVNTRRVTGRNTPTVINAVFNHRNFWDGRASVVFNGRNPFGRSDAVPNVLVSSGGRLEAVNVLIESASLASQAVGPVLNGVEMSYDGRGWTLVARRLMDRPALARQRVAPDDSALGSLARTDGRGLSLTYRQMIEGAFRPAYWESQGTFRLADGTEVTHTEFNFPLYWGLASGAYMATLVSDDSPFDRASEGGDALTGEQQRGRQIFNGQGRCENCHSGPEFTRATAQSIARRGLTQGGRGGPNQDTGFFRTGVRPASEDIGLGGQDDFGFPLSFARSLNPGANGVNGAFKTPGLRNITLTGPYFHNGGQSTLEQVVDFYARGGDFPNGTIRRFNASPADRAALVAFMRTLTDERVLFERAPFDHPELCVPAGHPEVQPGVLRAANPEGPFRLSATDRWVGIPAVGRGGNSVPLQTFDELLRGIGTDGTRAHAMTSACGVPDN